MARLPRFFIDGAAQHVVQRGNNRHAMFADPADFRFYADCIAFAARRHGVAVHAYVLMTNHVHLLVTPRDRSSIPRTMQSTGRVYVKYFNGKYTRSGTLLEGRYKATVVDNECYLLTCMRYIELNPVRARLVASPGDYPWSSFHANATGRPDPIVEQHPLFRAIAETTAERQALWSALMASGVPDRDVAAIRDATQHAWALGRPSFRDRVMTSGRRAERLPLGRPHDATGATRDRVSDPTFSAVRESGV